VRVDSQLAITINEGTTASAVAGLGIAASSENSARAELEAGQLVGVLPDRDGSECALRQRKDHKRAARAFTESFLRELRAV
jgi:DNA-binding transcriptional LysR family regulator